MLNKSMSTADKLALSPFVPQGGTVRVSLMTPPPQVRVTVYSKVRPGAAMRRDTEYGDMKQFRGGEEAAIARVAIAIAMKMNEDYGDSFNDYQVANAAVAGLRDAKKQIDMDMVQKRYLEIDEDQHVVVEAVSSDDQT